MRKIYNPSGSTVYHCMSRCVQGRRLLNAAAQSVFRKMLWQAADFSGLEIITYCVMSNHFHVLVRVPTAGVDGPSDAELVRRFKVLYPDEPKHSPLTAASLEQGLAQGGEAADRLRTQLLRRMHDVSEFMRTLKLRFSLWYNREHALYGAFWASRFHCVLVEDTAQMIQTVAAYIDLNPVRAGLVKDPKDYRSCGYAEAVLGVGEMRKCLNKLMHIGSNCETKEEGVAAYRTILFILGRRDVRGKASISESAARRVIQLEEGKLSKINVLATRLRHFTAGLVVGSERFVRSQMPGRQEKRLGDMQAVGLGGLYSLRKPRR